MSTGREVQCIGDRSARKRRRRWSWLLLLVGIGIVSWLEPDRDDLFDMCATQGQPIVHRTVIDDGYFEGSTDDCWNCWNYLRNTDYKFIEFTLSKKRREDEPISEPGVYRVSRIDAGSLRCNAELTDHYTKTRLRRELMQSNNWCFQVERLDSRQARYGSYQEGLGIVESSPVTGTSIHAARRYWLDHDSNEVIAEYTNYALTPYSGILPSSSSADSHCNSFFDVLGPRDIKRQDIIQPGEEAT